MLHNHAVDIGEEKMTKKEFDKVYGSPWANYWHVTASEIIRGFTLNTLMS